MNAWIITVLVCYVLKIILNLYALGYIEFPVVYDRGNFMFNTIVTLIMLVWGLVVFLN
jgi:hypothetical protein